MRSGVEVHDAQRAARGTDPAIDHLHRRGLAGTVDPEKSETLLPADVEVYPANGAYGAVIFCEPPRFDYRFRHDRRGFVARTKAALAVRRRKEWTQMPGKRARRNLCDDKDPFVIRHLFRMNKQPKLPPACPSRTPHGGC